MTADEFIEKNTSIYLENDYSLYVSKWLDANILIDNTNESCRYILNSIAHSYYELNQNIKASEYYLLLIKYYISQNVKNDEYYQALAFYYVCNKHRNIIFRYKILNELSVYDVKFLSEKEKLENRFIVKYFNIIVLLIFACVVIILLKRVLSLDITKFGNYFINVFLILSIISILMKSKTELILKRIIIFLSRIQNYNK